MKLPHIFLPICLLILAPSVKAERADRNKPMLLEADRASIDDAKKIQILEGNVVITKGTMVLKADRILITEDQYGFQKGIAFGGKNGLARFRQKREGKDEYIDGEAERIEYNTRNEVAELFHRAWVKSGEDIVKGNYIWFDGVSEKYLVTAGENLDTKGQPPRVRAIIQPKSRNTSDTQSESRGESLRLKGDAGIGTPRGQ